MQENTMESDITSSDEGESQINTTQESQIEHSDSMQSQASESSKKQESIWKKDMEVVSRTEDCPDGNPQVLHLQAVMKMFVEIKQQIQNSKKDTEDNLQLHQKKQNDKVSKIQQELIRYKIKNDILTGTVKRVCCEMLEMEKRMEKVETHMMRKSVVMSEFEGSQKKAQCIQQL